MNSDQLEERTERGHLLEFAHACARYLLLLSSAVCLLVWVLFWALFISQFDWPVSWGLGGDLSRQFMFYFPFIYLLAGVVLTLIRVNRWVLIGAAAILNLPLFALALHVLSRRAPGAYDAIWIAFLALWSLLCVTAYRRAVS